MKKYFAILLRKDNVS